MFDEMKIGKCITCRYWNQNKDNAWMIRHIVQDNPDDGLCMKHSYVEDRDLKECAFSPDNFYNENLAIAYCHSESCGSELITDKEFGCIQYCKNDNFEDDEVNNEMNKRKKSECKPNKVRIVVEFDGNYAMDMANSNIDDVRQLFMRRNPLDEPRIFIEEIK